MLWILLSVMSCDFSTTDFYSYSADGDLYRFPLGSPYEIKSISKELNEYWTIELNGFKPYLSVPGRQIAWLDSLAGYKGVSYLHSNRIEVSGGAKRCWIVIDPCSRTEQLVLSSETEKYKKISLMLRDSAKIYELSSIVPDFISHLAYPDELKRQIITPCSISSYPQKGKGQPDYRNLGDYPEKTNGAESKDVLPPND